MPTSSSNCTAAPKGTPGPWPASSTRLLASPTGGTLLKAPGIEIQAAAREYTGKVTAADLTLADARRIIAEALAAAPSRP
ncbi:MAG: hypothetical protein FJ291_03325 [Planctomycetes bacterium]|nr:hypothetical protein [Planctomycetota bacterium]